MALQISGACHYHPMRPGIGVCVECRQVVCAECSTQFEGINRCAQCLGKMSRRAAAKKSGSDFGFFSIFTSLVVFGLLFGGLAWAAQALVP
jgi:hypothetical protein